MPGNLAVGDFDIIYCEQKKEQKKIVTNPMQKVSDKLLKETEPIHVRQVLLSLLRITSETKISQKIQSR